MVDLHSPTGRVGSGELMRRMLPWRVEPMHLDMKSNCEKCGRALGAGAEPYICSYECTFCESCAMDTHHTCPNCGGELLRRPRRAASGGFPSSAPAAVAGKQRAWLIWVASFGVWTLVALAASFTIYKFERMHGTPMTFASTAALEFSQILTYAPLTPFVFMLAIHYPFRRRNWGRWLLLYLVGGLIFSAVHVGLRGLVYGVWDASIRAYAPAVFDWKTHVFHVRWDLFETLFVLNVVDDITGTYTPIVLIAHAVAYYRGLRERELRASQLQAQLAKAQLQALKNQLQPHFLFNTLHSISSLMLTDPHAADRMMTRLSDLLRMILDDAGTQITTLSRELEFVNCYLEIEKVRFEERLSVLLDIAPDTLDALVPHLLLQPLVDNAVKHGVSRRSEGGEIRIASAARNGELQISVADNGAGLGTTDASWTHGLGLRATRERLETLYGQNQSLELQSPPEGGVTVQIHIPLQVQSHDEIAVTKQMSSSPAAANGGAGVREVRLSRND